MSASGKPVTATEVVASAADWEARAQAHLAETRRQVREMLRPLIRKTIEIAGRNQPQ